MDNFKERNLSDLLILNNSVRYFVCAALTLSLFIEQKNT